MHAPRKLGLFFFLVAVAGAGYFVVTLLPQLIANYQKAAEFHPVWGTIYLVACSIVGLVILGLAGWTIWMLTANSRLKRSRRASRSRAPSQMTVAERESEFNSRLAESQSLADDAALADDVRGPIRQAGEELADKLASQTLEIVAFGTISSGKSSLLNTLAGQEFFRTDAKGGTTAARNEIPWPGVDKVVLVDTPGLAEIDGRERESLARRAARDADLVLFVADGPLRDFEFRLLEQLAELEKRVLVCLNKEDWFQPADRDLLAGQIAEQVRRIVPREDVVTVRARPITRSRVRVLPDGREIEEAVELEPDISALAERMMAIVGRDGRDLLLANLLLRARGLVAEARQQVQTVLDRRAQQLVDRTMWQAGGAAALSPLPLLDVAAALALSTKMVVGLARIYRQPVDWDTATRLVGELGKNLVSILGTTAVAPAIGSALATALKAAPGVGTIAGGVLQGLVQALVTRWIGQVFVVYFRDEMKEPATGWAALARAKWDEVTRPAELLQLVKTGVARLGHRAGEDHSVKPKS